MDSCVRDRKQKAWFFLFPYNSQQWRIFTGTTKPKHCCEKWGLMIVQLCNKVKDSMMLNAISLAECKGFSSKTTTLSTNLKEVLVIRALNRERFCLSFATAQWQPWKDCHLPPLHHRCPTLDYQWWGHSGDDYILHNNNFLYLKKRFFFFTISSFTAEKSYYIAQLFFFLKGRQCLHNFVRVVGCFLKKLVLGTQDKRKGLKSDPTAF